MPATDKSASGRREEFRQLLKRLFDGQLRTFLGQAKALTPSASPKADR